jgi:hypothetical protein
MRDLHVVAADADSIRWVEISRIGFWLRHPQFLGAGKDRPEGLAGKLHRFERLGNELAILEYDIAQCINEFLIGYQLLYERVEDIALKKFSIVYHIDNLYVRVRKLIENVYGMLALTVGLDLGKRVSFGDKREHVRNAVYRLRLEQVAKTLRDFEDNEHVKQAVEARNLFVHHYREEPKWTILHPESRLRELTPKDTVGEQVRVMTEAGDLDRYADRRADDARRMLYAIRRVRDRLHEVLTEALSKVVSELAPATREQLPPFVDGITGLGPRAEKLASILKAAIEAAGEGNKEERGSEAHERDES